MKNARTFCFFFCPDSIISEKGFARKMPRFFAIFFWPGFDNFWKRIVEAALYSATPTNHQLPYKSNLQGRLANHPYKLAFCNNTFIGAADKTARTNAYQPPLKRLGVVVSPACLPPLPSYFGCGWACAKLPRQSPHSCARHLKSSLIVHPAWDPHGAPQIAHMLLFPRSILRFISNSGNKG